MWTLRVAVVVGGIGVDANLRILQVLRNCRTRGVAELREETSRRGAIPVGARGGLGVNREIAGSSSVRARRTSLVRRPVQGHVVAVQGQYLQRSSSSSVE
ncbi:hypothetical protein Taro_024286 [Colocasia esculenta]|uniref:Uncharacterized protein n=1 Tax=Colocasia esculenta TaxID=4460 RepID=A0A843VD87_COLES|nr:hypothetical protein [Colocasia esculenta]